MNGHYLDEKEMAEFDRWLDNTMDSGVGSEIGAPWWEEDEAPKTVVSEPEEEAINYYVEPDCWMRDQSDKFRRKLKLGLIPFQVAWFNGFFKSKCFYRKGTRMYKAYQSGRRAHV